MDWIIRFIDILPRFPKQREIMPKISPEVQPPSLYRNVVDATKKDVCWLVVCCPNKCFPVK